jgi:hypothetical protein
MSDNGMNGNNGLLSSGLGMVLRNKRYIVWFYLLNFLLGLFGTAAFANHAEGILERSLLSERLVHGFQLDVLMEMFARPEFGPMTASARPALFFSIVFMLATALFLPGVFQGYASTYRLPREDFFRACGRNLWRYIRLLFISGLLMGIVAGILFGINGVIVKKADDSTNEMLPFTLQMIGLGVIFLVMSTLRIWFDLTEASMVLDDQGVWKSLGPSLRHTFRGLFRLLGSYIVITIVAAIMLVGGIWLWITVIPAEGIFAAFLLGQLTVLLLLIPRFWQRGVIVAYWQGHMVVPVVVMQPVIVAPDPVPAPLMPGPIPVVPSTPTENPAT